MTNTPTHTDSDFSVAKFLPPSDPNTDNRLDLTTDAQRTLFTGGNTGTYGACGVGVVYADVINAKDGGPGAAMDITGDFINNLVTKRTDADGKHCVESIAGEAIEKLEQKAYDKLLPYLREQAAGPRPPLRGEVRLDQLPR